MGLFSKTEKKEMMLDFKLIPPTKGDRETFLIDIEADICLDDSSTTKYLYATIMVNSLIYDEFLDVLSKYNGKIKYILNIKNGVIKKFNIDFKDLATVLQNEEIRHCWIAGYGVNENRYLG